jgi:hypothetical protein
MDGEIGEAVIQKSGDRGRTWRPIIPVGPGFPRNASWPATQVALSWGSAIGRHYNSEICAAVVTSLALL